MSFIPQEIPTGAVRYNTDSNKMEVYIGSTWMEVAVSTPNLDGGARGVFFFGFDDTNNPRVVDAHIPPDIFPLDVVTSPKS